MQNKANINKRKGEEAKRVGQTQDASIAAPSEALKARYAHYEQRLVPVKQWETLEDFALKNDEATLKFNVVLQDQGRERVDIRKNFLEVDQRTIGLRL